MIMATVNERFWTARGKVKRSFIVRFVGPEGKRHIQTFDDEANAREFWASILPREERWGSARLLAELDRRAGHGQRS